MTEKETYLNKVKDLVNQGWSMVYSKNKARRELGISTYNALEYLKESPETSQLFEHIKYSRKQAKRYKHDRYK